MCDSPQAESTLKKERTLPDYTRGEERMNMITHIVGGGFGILALVLCVVVSALHHSPWGVVSSALYGTSMIVVYSVSSVYHGLRPHKGKRVMRIIDHCTIYFLIAGTYTPILLCAVRPLSPLTAWGLFALVWGLGALAVTLTAVNLKRYSVFSMICYVGMGWCIVLDLGTVLDALGKAGFSLLLAGGVAYTVGAILYGIGKKRRYMHSVFHIFVVIGSVLQFFCILFYVL